MDVTADSSCSDLWHMFKLDINFFCMNLKILQFLENFLNGTNQNHEDTFENEQEPEKFI